MKNKNLHCIFICVIVSVWTGVAHSQTVLLPPGSIATASILLPGQSPEPDDDTDVDVFFPTIDARFPIAIVLQGGLVTASSYSQFGLQLARHGFVVAIPNRFNALFPGAPAVPFPDERVVVEALDQLELENSDPGSPLNDRVDNERLGLAGHSVGGFVGLLVIEGSCVEPFCFGDFQRPAALQAGAFYGTNSIDPFTGQLIDVDTGAIPVALVQGSLDSIGTPAEAAATFDILDGPRELITIEGANHYGITNENNPPGAQPDFSSPTLSQADGILQIAQAMGESLNNRIFGLLVSASGNRSNPLPLKGQSLSGNTFIFLTPEFPPVEISRVDFFLDGNLRRTESAAPYDLGGTTNFPNAGPFDTRTLANGAHVVTASIQFSSGGQQSVSTSFFVNNPISSDDDDDDDDDD